MNAAAVLEEARAAGVVFAIVGEKLHVRADKKPTPALCDAIRLHKPDIIALLRPTGDGWTTEDLKAFFYKRVEILEFHCQMPRSLAESHAYEGCIVQWLVCNPVDSPPGRCLSCGRGDGLEGPPVLSYQQKGNEPAWLHQSCWKTWHGGRRVVAAAALTAIGIPLPVKRLWRHETKSVALEER
jgi:hypothetical protein